MMIAAEHLNRSISVIGLGNVFLGDDGFGPLVVEIFRCLYECGPDVEVLDLGTPGLDLAPYLFDSSLVVVVDAVHADMKPGTLSIFHEDDFSANQAQLRITGHDPGLWDTLTHLRLADHGPTELVVIGAIPGSCVFGGGISEVTMSLAPEAARQIAQLLVDRGISCVRRTIEIVPNLWWLPAVDSRETIVAKTFSSSLSASGCLT